MEFVTYILYSFHSKRFYVGYSSNLIQRIYWHNNGDKGFTTRFRPWIVIYVEFYETKKEALAKESYLKSGKGREWVRNNFVESQGFISA